jgi:hypothetical protein
MRTGAGAVECADVGQRVAGSEAPLFSLSDAQAVHEEYEPGAEQVLQRIGYRDENLHTPAEKIDHSLIHADVCRCCN